MKTLWLSGGGGGEKNNNNNNNDRQIVRKVARERWVFEDRFSSFLQMSYFLSPLSL